MGGEHQVQQRILILGNLQIIMAENYFFGLLVILVLLGVFEFILGCNKIITFSQSKVIDEIVVFSSIILIIIIGEVKIRHIKI